jgi:hypothetical protein
MVSNKPWYSKQDFLHVYQTPLKKYHDILRYLLYQNFKNNLFLNTPSAGRGALVAVEPVEVAHGEPAAGSP